MNLNLEVILSMKHVECNVVLTVLKRLCFRELSVDLEFAVSQGANHRLEYGYWQILYVVHIAIIITCTERDIERRRHRLID